MKNLSWLVVAAAAALFVAPAPASAMSAAEEARWIEALDLDAGLFYAGGGSSGSVVDSREAFLGLYDAEPPRSAESKGKRWWKRNAWWVITVGVLIILTPSALWSTSLSAVGGAAGAYP